MLRRIRPLAAASLLLAGAAGLFYYGADLVPRAEPDGNAPSTRQDLREESSPTEEELERRRHIFLRREAVKHQVAMELLAGRLTLLQAAAGFRDLDKALPVTWAPRGAARGPAGAERLCRVVMGRANRWMERNRPGQAADVAAGLEAELERQRQPDGTIRLPD